MPSSHLSPASTKIPALLEPYILDGAASRQGDSLTLITSIQGASSNWLVLRYLVALLAAKRGGEENGEEAGVVLVSFLRDLTFWREGCSRLGLDLEALSRQGRFVFADGLTGMFTCGAARLAPGTVVLTSPKVDDIQSQLSRAVTALKSTGKKVLLVDGMDALMAVSEGVDALSLQSILLSLREGVFSAVVTMAADEPLVQAQTTTLEREHAALALGLAHAADEVVSLRKLDTGAAGDVSGVLRVGKSAEVLYHIGGDGAVKAFERGT